MIMHLLEKYKLKYEELSSDEKATLEQMAAKYRTNEMTIEEIKRGCREMIHSLERELVDYTPNPSLAAWLFRKKRKIHVEARLKNMLWLEEFITAPEKAQKIIEDMVKNLQK